GVWHSVAVTSEGEAFTWGYGVNGQLGKSAEGEGSRIPRKVEIECEGRRHIEGVSCGSRHTVVWDDSHPKNVWVFGYNRFGQLGVGTTEDEMLPKKVVGVSKISAVYAGDWGTFFLCKPEEES